MKSSRILKADNLYFLLLFISSNLLAQTNANDIEGIWYSSDINGYISIQIVSNRVLVIDLDHSSPRTQALKGLIENPRIEYFSYIGEVNFDIEPFGFAVQSLKPIESELLVATNNNSNYLFFTFDVQNQSSSFSDCCPVCSCINNGFSGLIKKVF